MIQLETLALTAITESAFNPRKHFDVAKLQELADSIKVHGVLQPIVVRPLPGARVAETDRRVQYEIVAGARRFRASQVAERKDIPAVIRLMNDQEALEAAILENLQRDNLNALEEAEGFEALMAHGGMTADDVGAKVGKSRAFVYARLKLIDLSHECKQALREDRVDASRALLIARIPDTALQLKALTYAQEACHGPQANEVPSVRALQLWLRNNVMLRLDRAVFKITDASLVKAAGSCMDCSKRTGANPDLFAEDSDDLCIDPTCFHGKEEAHRAELVRKAEAKGMRLVEGKEAAEICNQWQDAPRGYTTLDQKRADAVAEGAPTLRELLQEDDAPKGILFEHPRTKVLMELVQEDEAEAYLVNKGLVQAGTTKGKAVDPGAELEKLQKVIADRTATYTHERTMDAAIKAILATPDVDVAKLISTDMLRNWVVTMLAEASVGRCATALAYEFQEGEDEIDGLTMRARACSDAELVRAVAVLMLDMDTYAERYDQQPLILDGYAQLLGVDRKQAEKQANIKLQEEYAARIADLQAQIEAAKAKGKAKPKTEKAVLPTASLAQPNNTREGGPKSKAKRPAGAAAPKMSAEEALSGIAAAMQGVDRSASAPDGAVAPTEVTTKEAAVDPVTYTTATNIVIVQRKTDPAHLVNMLGVSTAVAIAMLARMQDENIVSKMDENGRRTVLAPYPAQETVDPLLAKAVEVITRHQKANVRLLKAELKVGTAKALEIMDQLEHAGKVSACDERGARTVLEGASA